LYQPARFGDSFPGENKNMIYYRAARAKLLLLTFLFLVTALGIFAAEGELDPTFDGDGIVTTDNGSTDESIYDLVVQPDGKTIAIGNSFGTSGWRTVIVRYNPDGSIDSTFGTSGKVFIPSVFPGEAALQPNGKIVLAGTYGEYLNGDFYAARLNSDGSFDTTFNGTGAVILDLRGINDLASSVKVQPDGKIVVGGSSARSASASDAALYRSDAWHILGTTRGYYATQFGVATDIPAPADFDGDGKTDLAVFRNGVWYLLRSQQGFTGTQFGQTNDKPVPNAYIP